MSNEWKSKTPRVFDVVITPEIATEMLSYEIEGNRFTPRHTDTIAKAMTAGDFVYTADPIKFIRDGPAE